MDLQVLLNGRMVEVEPEIGTAYIDQQKQITELNNEVQKQHNYIVDIEDKLRRRNLQIKDLKATISNYQMICSSCGKNYHECKCK